VNAIKRVSGVRLISSHDISATTDPSLCILSIVARLETSIV